MHLSNRQRTMNKTFTILSNKHCSPYRNVEQDQLNPISENINQLSTALSDDRFRTFTKCKIKSEPETVIVNHHQQQRYFDSPTMLILDDVDEQDEIPVSRCSNRTSGTAAVTSAEPSLDETELSDLLIFTNPHRLLSESMQVVISRHPSLNDFKYINDVSSVLVLPSLFRDEQEEPIYQELIRPDHSVMTPSMDYVNTADENKENRPPLMPIKCQVSRIPIWTPSPTDKCLNVSEITVNNSKHEEVKKKVKTTAKPCLTDLLDDWSRTTPKLKELLSNTRKMPLRMPHLTANSTEFRRLKQLLNEMEVTTSSWTNAINQCRYVLQHAQQQFRRS